MPQVETRKPDHIVDTIGIMDNIILSLAILNILGENVYDNGAQQEFVKTNIGFFGRTLGSSKYIVELHYEVQSLSGGAIISGITIAAYRKLLYSRKKIKILAFEK